MAKASTIFNALKEKHLKTLSEEKIVLEGKNDYVLYHDSYTDAIAEAVAFAEKNGYTTDDDNRFNEIGIGPGRPKRGKTVKHTLKLFKKDKEQKKALQIQVYNRDTSKNTFELNTYIR